MLKIRDWLDNKQKSKNFEPIEFFHGDIIEVRRLSDSVYFKLGDKVYFKKEDPNEMPEVMEVICFYDDNIHVDIETPLYVMKIDINLLVKINYTKQSKSQI